MHGPSKKPDNAWIDDVPDAEEINALLDRLEAFAARPNVDEQHRRDLMLLRGWFCGLSALAALEIRRLSNVAKLGEMAAKLGSAADELEMKILKAGPAIMRSAKAKRHPEWPRINELIDQGLALNLKPKLIEKMLADEGLVRKPDALRQQIGRRRKKKLKKKR